MYDKTLIVAGTIFLFGSFFVAAKAAEWSEQYQRLCGLLSCTSKEDARKTLFKLKYELDHSAAGGDNLKMINDWLRLAEEPLTRDHCNEANVTALANKSGSSLGLRSFLRETRNRLIQFCTAEFTAGLRSWSSQKLVASLTHWVSYNEKPVEDHMVDRLYRYLNRSLQYLRQVLFDVRAGEKENFKRFLHHYDTNCPCNQEPLVSYVKQYPNFVAFFQHPTVESHLSRKDHEIMRRALACLKLNQMENAKYKAFLMIYSQVGDITVH